MLLRPGEGLELRFALKLAALAAAVLLLAVLLRCDGCKDSTLYASAPATGSPLVRHGPELQARTGPPAASGGGAVPGHSHQVHQGHQGSAVSWQSALVGGAVSWQPASLVRTRVVWFPGNLPWWGVRIPGNRPPWCAPG